MNYYIQGDPARAEEIKAEFKRLGIDTTAINVGDEDFIYFSSNGLLYFEEFSNALLKIFKTHPGYKELELPVKPKFNDGDVLVTTKIRSCPFIYRKTGYNNDLAYYYAGIDGNGDFIEGCLKRTLCHFGPTSDVAPATKEQRELLFQKMKENGYEWDADKKELRKIQPHYDISNFNPFDKVLVRQDDSCTWGMSFFGRYAGMFLCCSNACFTQCIPFNDDTKHLLGTTDMCDEIFINW